MYDYIKGIITELTPTSCTIEASGVGYFLNISLTTYSSISDKYEGTNKHEEGKQTRLFVHLIVREDEHLLFGFAEKIERELFRHLISVSGVGANTARTILSSYPPAELAQIIETGGSAAIKKVKGVGPKTAEKIVIDLKDKMKNLGNRETSESSSGTAFSNPVRTDAIQALTMLGYTAQACEKVVDGIIKTEPSIAVEKLIKEALRKL